MRLYVMGGGSMNSLLGLLDSVFQEAETLSYIKDLIGGRKGSLINHAATLVGPDRIEVDPSICVPSE